MNEKIKELVKAAVLAVDGCTGDEAKDEELSRMYIPDRFAEKFAELIVRECLDIVDDEGCGEGGSVRAVQKIREHFGVDQ